MTLGELLAAPSLTQRRAPSSLCSKWPHYGLLSLRLGCTPRDEPGGLRIGQILPLLVPSCP